MKLPVKLLYFLLVFIAIHILIQHFAQIRNRERNLESEIIKHLEESDSDMDADDIANHNDIVEHPPPPVVSNNIEIVKPELNHHAISHNYDEKVSAGNDYLTSFMDDYFKTLQPDLVPKTLNIPSQNEFELAKNEHDELNVKNQIQYNTTAQTNELNNNIYNYHNTIPTKFNILPENPNAKTNANVVVINNNENAMIERMTLSDIRNAPLANVESYQTAYGNPYSDIMQVNFGNDGTSVNTSNAQMESEIKNAIENFIGSSIEAPKMSTVPDQFSIKNGEIQHTPSAPSLQKRLTPKEVTIDHSMANVSNFSSDLLASIGSSKDKFEAYNSNGFDNNLSFSLL